MLQTPSWARSLATAWRPSAATSPWTWTWTWRLMVPAGWWGSGPPGGTWPRPTTPSTSPSGTLAQNSGWNRDSSSLAAPSGGKGKIPELHLVFRSVWKNKAASLTARQLCVLSSLSLFGIIGHTMLPLAATQRPANLQCWNVVQVFWILGVSHPACVTCSDPAVSHHLSGAVIPPRRTIKYPERL